MGVKKIWKNEKKGIVFGYLFIAEIIYVQIQWIQFFLLLVFWVRFCFKLSYLDNTIYLSPFCLHICSGKKRVEAIVFIESHSVGRAKESLLFYS